MKDLAAQVKQLEKDLNKDAGKDLTKGKMGNDFSKGVDSAVAIVTGIITGDITGGLAGASAPWIAGEIKKQAGDNETARLVAHAILGAVVAELQGHSGVVGGASAVSGELAAKVIRDTLYNKDVKDLTEEEKENISALTQLAVGLTIASMGGDESDITTGVNSSKNAVENNGLARGVIKGLEKGYESCMKIASCRNALMQLGLNFGLTNTQIEEAMKVGQTRDINQIKELTPEQIAWLDAQIIANKGLSHIMFGDKTFGDRIYNESLDDNDKNNEILGGSGAIAAGGAPGLPPDDDENKNSNKNNENSQQPSEAGKGNVDSKNSEKIKTTWHEGSNNTPEESLQKHFEKHGKEVNAETAEQYLNKAKAFSENLKGARVVENVGKYTEGVTRYYKNGKYIDIAPDKRIISFGKQ